MTWKLLRSWTRGFSKARHCVQESELGARAFSQASRSPVRISTSARPFGT